ncbi:MAG TPA: hypothetical protein VJN95_06045 [Gemmatimonadales bacterium]|nr:hypothetical protein [Gemmatimonadales bacterium]
MRTAFSACLFLLAVPLASAEAQRWREDSNSIRLDWGAVKVMVSADSIRGLQIRARTSSLDYRGAPRSYSAMFDPLEVESWMQEANAVVEWTRPPGSDSARALETSGLLAADGSEMLIQRKRKKEGWDSNMLLVFRPRSGEHSWALMAGQDQMREFLKSLVFDEVRSRLTQEAADSAATSVNSLELDDPPSMLSHPPLEFPQTAVGVNRKSSEVWLEYVIGVDGKADPESIVVVWFNDRRYVEEAVRVIVGSRFKPGMINHQPVRTVVFQPVEWRGE